MIKKLIKWFKRNPCKSCDYYKENNICQSKKCATCGCHPYVNWFDKHFCKPYKAESEDKEMTEEDKLYADELRKRAYSDYERLNMAIDELERQTCDSPRNNLEITSQERRSESE